MVFERGNKIYARAYINGVDTKIPIGVITPENRRKAKLLEQELKLSAGIAKENKEPWEVFKKLKSSRQRISFKQLTNEFLSEKADAKASSIQQYQSVIHSHLLPAFGHIKDLRDISEAMVATWQTKLALEKLSNGKTRSASRVNTIVQQLRTLMATAERREYISKDPTKNIKRKQEPKPDIDPLSEDELELVLLSIDSHYKPLFATLAYTGARPNELEALRWSDIDWQREEIRINKGLVRGIEGLPKTKSAHRTLPMVAPVKAALLELKSRNLQSADNFVFMTKKGQPIKRHLNRIWARALKQCGLRHRPSYQLRHTFASQCLMKGFAPGYIAQLLGHSGLEMIYRHYARWINDATKKQEQLLRDSFKTKDEHTPKIEMLS